MQVGAVHDSVGVAHVVAERLAEVHIADALARRGVHQAQGIDVDRRGSHRLAHAERIEAVERVRADLDARADLAQLRRGLDDDRADALLRQGGGGGDAADARRRR